MEVRDDHVGRRNEVGSGERQLNGYLKSVNPFLHTAQTTVNGLSSTATNPFFTQGKDSNGNTVSRDINEDIFRHGQSNGWSHFPTSSTPSLENDWAVFPPPTLSQKTNQTTFLNQKWDIGQDSDSATMSAAGQSKQKSNICDPFKDETSVSQRMVADEETSKKRDYLLEFILANQKNDEKSISSFTASNQMDVLEHSSSFLPAPITTNDIFTNNGASQSSDIFQTPESIVQNKVFQKIQLFQNPASAQNGNSHLSDNFAVRNGQFKQQDSHFDKMILPTELSKGIFQETSTMPSPLNASTNGDLMFKRRPPKPTPRSKAPKNPDQSIDHDIFSTPILPVPADKKPAQTMFTPTLANPFSIPAVPRTKTNIQDTMISDKLNSSQVYEDILFIGQEKCVEDWPDDSPEFSPEWKPSGKLKLRRESLRISLESEAALNADTLGKKSIKKKKKLSIIRNGSKKVTSIDDPMVLQIDTVHRDSKEKHPDSLNGAYGDSLPWGTKYYAADDIFLPEEEDQNARMKSQSIKSKKTKFIVPHLKYKASKKKSQDEVFENGSPFLQASKSEQIQESYEDMLRNSEQKEPVMKDWRMKEPMKFKPSLSRQLSKDSIEDDLKKMNSLSFLEESKENVRAENESRHLSADLLAEYQREQFSPKSSDSSGKVQEVQHYRKKKRSIKFSVPHLSLKGSKSTLENDIPQKGADLFKASDIKGLENNVPQDYSQLREFPVEVSPIIQKVSMGLSDAEAGDTEEYDWIEKHTTDVKKEKLKKGRLPSRESKKKFQDEVFENGSPFLQASKSEQIQESYEDMLRNSEQKEPVTKDWRMKEPMKFKPSLSRQLSKDSIEDDLKKMNSLSFLEESKKLRQALGGQVVLPDDWETTAEVIRETGRNVLGVSSGRRKEDKETWWWNEEVQESIQRKRLAKKKWDMERTEENRQEYKESQHRVKREVSKAKQKAYDELYTRLDTREGEKDLYRLARQRDRDGKDVQQVRVIKDRDGRVLTSEESVQRRWKEYFEELMDEENDREKRVEGVNSVEQKVDKIRKDEVRKALKRMKSGKAVGPDDIPVEVWKCLGEAAVEFLASLFNRVLESERMPEEWRRSVLVPIFKNKGDVQSCSNYRGIKLMSHTMKLWERVVEARLRKVVDICEQQYGFMPRKSTTDAIFALRILMEKYRDGQRELHCVFVDLEKAYDRVPREELWYCMRKSGVAEKYVRVVQDMYERSRTVVRCAVGQTEEFKVEVGLHQGSTLSPFLFAIVMDQLSEEVRQESPWTMMFADDIVICSESREQVEENLERWRFALERRGMKVSRSKTEYTCVNKREGSGTVRLQGEKVKKVQEFKYLGSTVQSNGECGKEARDQLFFPEDIEPPGATSGDYYLSEAAKAEWMSSQMDVRRARAPYEDEELEELKEEVDGDTDSLMEWWNTVELWDELPDEELSLKEDETKSFTEIDNKVHQGLRVFYKVFTEHAEVLYQLVLRLYTIADNISNFHRRAKIANITGGTTTAVGGVAAITGLALAPVTFGASLIVSAVGLGVATAGGITAASASISDNVHDMNDRKKIEVVVQDYETRLAELRRCLRFVAEGVRRMRFHPLLRRNNYYAGDWEVRRALQTISLVGDPVEHAEEIVEKSTVALKSVCKGMDNYFSKDSKELKKGCKKEVTMQVNMLAKLLHEDLVALNSIREQLMEAMGHV
ncbi:hypothetical protein QTP70_019647 [Hemibagrus guttatus]|uniref:ribonuclease H n=1 Tax=Hemibagrus guttatus TaxID=175788 RepID=A0AAE0PSV1_9TELE|nr:hypothetical protein QTP70_019647 [Hemibagrus guttatus]